MAVCMCAITWQTILSENQLRGSKCPDCTDARVGLLYLLFARIHLQALNSFVVTKPFETMLLDTYKSLFLGAWTFPVCLHMLQLLFL